MVTAGNAAFSVDDKAESAMRKPVEPVSTRIWSMIWQLVVLPGAQIFTLM